MLCVRVINTSLDVSSSPLLWFSKSWWLCCHSLTPTAPETFFFPWSLALLLTAEISFLLGVRSSLRLSGLWACVCQHIPAAQGPSAQFIGGIGTASLPAAGSRLQPGLPLGQAPEIPIYLFISPPSKTLNCFPKWRRQQQGTVLPGEAFGDQPVLGVRRSPRVSWLPLCGHAASFWGQTSSFPCFCACPAV